MNKPTPALPTIHLNGTGKSRLLDDACETGAAIRKALDTMVENGPNARDYYPQGDAGWDRARKEHESRVERVRAVYAEYLAIAEGIAGGGHKS